MALTDLIITNEQISEELVEKILKSRIELVKEGNKIILTRESMSFPNKTKVLLFLSGGKAWELLEKISLSFSPTEMEGALSIPGNSLRPILKELSDIFLVSSDKGKYQITSKGIYELETILEDSIKDKDGIQVKKSKLVRSAKSSNSSSTPSKTKAIEELIGEGYFSSPRDSEEMLTELGRRGVTVKPTSLPAYLLPLVRKKVLVRDIKEKNKRKVWAYKKSNG